ncbi:hypothetical protein BJ322DRAFT_130553 [Thelephora terrestris]|uniref:BTB domain-containing protein n=1 Tax=Thelephora terrestris TaxID=56493 RepID=A0A9P6HSX7_9AGAM|nr:hypothetical protein BJ322DRAFT_130553 [Thelephora terrestris]
MTIPIPLQEALRDSITSGTFIDTKFWVFSKWGSKTRGVGSPRALFVNEHVTRRVPRLAFLLDEREPTGNLRTKFPTDRKPYIGDYDYEDDSDLEDDDDEDASDSEDEHAAAPPAATEEPGNNAKVVTAENSDAEDETSVISSAHVGKVVVIEDVAFVTFQALLRYLYTDEIEFASWGSAERRIARARETISESYGIPKPSPKSIYRLADRYDIPELKKLALEQIRQDLSKCNIIEEALSKYTSWYPELRELELRQLARALLSADSDRNMKLLKEQIKEYTHGKLPHAKHVISALYKLMESNESVEEPPLPTTVAHNQGDAKRDWSGLKKALTNSLTSGTFLSSQFYALESWSSTGLHKTRPIYFCGTVDSSFTSTLTACSSELGLQSAPFMHTYWPDSDLGDDELDQGGPMGCPPPSRWSEDPLPIDYCEPNLLLSASERTPHPWAYRWIRRIL